jgi:hypothetical protein
MNGVYSYTLEGAVNPILLPRYWKALAICQPP